MPALREAEAIAGVVAERVRLGKATATAERLLRAGPDGYEHIGHIGRDGKGQRLIDAPLDRLQKHGFVTRTEFTAGDRYRADAYLAAVDPTTGAVDWAAAGGGGRSARVPAVFGSQTVYDARRRFRDIQARASGVVGAVAWLALVKEVPFVDLGRSVFGYRDGREAVVAGRVATRMACAALADLYWM